MLGRLQDGQLKLSRKFIVSPAPSCVFSARCAGTCLRVYEELKTGLREIAKRNIPILGLSVDSWGCDYVLINSVHPTISPPFHYRDDRTAATYERVRERVGAKLIFEETGIQFMPINTIYHLASDVEKSRPSSRLRIVS